VLTFRAATSRSAEFEQAAQFANSRVNNRSKFHATTRQSPLHFRMIVWIIPSPASTQIIRPNHIAESILIA
jgi:hypothetical protein